MTRPPRSSLYWRLLPSYLLVVVVALGTMVLAGEALAAPARRQLQRLERLADDLSLLSRVETGQVELHPEAVAVTALLEAVAEAFRPRFEAKGVVLDVEVAPEGRVWADAERSGQVLTNLVANALRFTPAGGRVTLAARGAGEGRVRFEVSDTGGGIPEEQLGLVFNRFYRGDQARAAGGGRQRHRPHARQAARGAPGRRHRRQQPPRARQRFLVHAAAGTERGRLARGAPGGFTETLHGRYRRFTGAHEHAP